MTEERIGRINELYHKAKAEGLTDAEKEEQQTLRQEYVESFKRNLRGNMDNIRIKEADGTITKPTKKK